MYKDYYKDEILEHLTNKTYYKKEPRYLEKTITSKIRRRFNEYQDSFTDKGKYYICNSVIKQSKIYGSPQMDIKCYKQT